MHWLKWAVVIIGVILLLGIWLALGPVVGVLAALATWLVGPVRDRVLARLPFLRSPGRAAVAVLLVVLIPWAIIAPRVISPSQPAAAPNVSVPTATAPILPTALSTPTAAPQPGPTAMPAAPTTAPASPTPVPASPTPVPPMATAPPQPTATSAPVQQEVSQQASTSVVSVVDGDTLDVRIDGQTYRVRLIGVDTPEVHGQVECYGREASDRTKALAPPGTPVRLEKDVSETDRYGRLLRYVYLPDGRMLNEVLVREGYAQVATYPPDVKYQDRFLEVQRQAREEGAGLWGNCQGRSEAAATATAVPEPTTPPASGGSGRAEPIGRDCPQKYPIKGNKSSSGELIYHVPGGQFYDRTVPEACFATEADARAAGFRRSQR